jgi:hypothetical protein
LGAAAGGVGSAARPAQGKNQARARTPSPIADCRLPISDFQFPIADSPFSTGPLSFVIRHLSLVVRHWSILIPQSANGK